jgi:hypothetical protein
LLAACPAADFHQKQAPVKYARNMRLWSTSKPERYTNRPLN